MSTYARSALCNALRLVPLLGVGCSGGVHRAGENQIGLTGSFGAAIKGETYWHDADGRADNAGVTVDYQRFLSDRWVVMAALTPARVYNQSDRDVYAGEFQAGFRYHFFEFDVGDRPVSLFAEILGGLLYGAHSVPERGSNFNFTQDLGAGVEVQLADRVSWVTGYRMKHLSNADLFNGENPAQNDHHVYTGIQISW